MVPVKNAVMKSRRAVFNENRCALVFAYDDLKIKYSSLDLRASARAFDCATTPCFFCPPHPNGFSLRVEPNFLVLVTSAEAPHLLLRAAL
jgi:hypothetical protein